MDKAAERFGRITESWAPHGALDWRVHDDGTICCVMPMIYTWSIVIGMEEMSYDYRYCYANLSDARAAFRVYEDHTTHPTGPWIKRKGHPDGELRGPAAGDVAEQRVPERGGAAAVDPTNFNDSEDV